MIRQGNSYRLTEAFLPGTRPGGHAGYWSMPLRPGGKEKEVPLSPQVRSRRRRIPLREDEDRTRRRRARSIAPAARISGGLPGGAVQGVLDGKPPAGKYSGAPGGAPSSAGGKRSHKRKGDSPPFSCDKDPSLPKGVTAAPFPRYARAGLPSTHRVI